MHAPRHRRWTSTFSDVFRSFIFIHITFHSVIAMLPLSVFRALGVVAESDSAYCQITLACMSLRLRSLHADLIMCYKILFGLVDVGLSFNDFFQYPTVVKTQAHPCQLFKEYSTNKARKT